MGFLSLFEVASMPILEVLIISILGAFMATDYLKLLPSDARRYLNKIVFVAFTPSLIFASLAKTVRLEDIISWKLGEHSLGTFYIWTYTFHLVRSAGEKYKAKKAAEELKKEANMDLDTNDHSFLLLLHGAEHVQTSSIEDTTQQPTMIESKQNAAWWSHIMAIFHQLKEELFSPPILAAIIGLVFGIVTRLRNLVIGENAPLRVINNSMKLLGDGTIPCITLILGGNLTQGLGKTRLKRGIIIAVICVRYILLPVVGIGIVQLGSRLGFLPNDPLYHFVLMIQFTLPPAMSIGTMTQLFDVAQEECAVLFLWTYLVAALALTVWSTLFMWILT
ncbi:hypothetical protein OROGR_011228 [Orobanche gracilis]